MTAWTLGGNGGDEKWMNEKNTPKMELTGIVDMSEVRCERRKGGKDDTEVSGLSN